MTSLSNSAEAGSPVDKLFVVACTGIYLAIISCVVAAVSVTIF